MKIRRFIFKLQQELFIVTENGELDLGDFKLEKVIKLMIIRHLFLILRV